MPLKAMLWKTRGIVHGAICVLLLFPFAKSMHRDAEIRGTVTACWEGTIRPLANIRVYVLTRPESSKIRPILAKIEQLPRGESTESVQQYFKAYDELLAAVKSLGRPRSLTRTDRAGHFAMKGLRAGEKYLVLAINWEMEVEIDDYQYVLTENLQPKGLELRFYMGPGKESECGRKK